MIKGIDVSDHQGKIDWTAVKKAGVQFAIIRLGYGSDIASQDDKRFNENVAGCEANGIPWGAYIYSYALNTAEAQSEVQHCLRLLKGKKPTYPIYFDMEDADGYKARHGVSNETIVSICYTFLRTMESNGYYVGLYASLNWLNGKLNDSRLDKYDKWVAQWNTVCQYDKPYGMWQYGGDTANYIDSKYVNGINGAVDKDYAYYDYPTIIKENGLNGWEKPKTETPTQTPTEKPQDKPTETPTEKPVETPAETDNPITETPAQGENENDTGKGIIETLKRLIKLLVEWAFGK